MSAFTIFVDGRPVEAQPDDTVAVILLREGFVPSGELSGRGFFCGMGSCYECHAVVDEVPLTRTCMTTASPGMSVRTRAAEDRDES